MRHVKLKHGIAAVSKDIKPETLNALDEMMAAAEKQMTQEVKTRPILFSTRMVEAILDDRKTMTRRVVKNRPGAKVDVQNAEWVEDHEGINEPWWAFKREISKTHSAYGQRLACNSIAIDTMFCPFGKPGIRLWVRETHYRYGYWRKDGLTKQGRQRWRFVAAHESRIPSQYAKVYYEATSRPPTILTKKSAKWGWHKRPSIFLPYALARIVNEITEIRVERLQDITQEDIAAEGFRAYSANARLQEIAVSDFAQGWDDINGKRSGGKYACSQNPFVWVICFRRIKPK